MPSTDWTHVRIRRTTHARLTRLLAILAVNGDGRYDPCLRHDHVYVSLDEAIGVLLDRDDNHRERAFRSRTRKKQPKTHGQDDASCLEV